MKKPGGTAFWADVIDNSQERAMILRTAEGLIFLGSSWLQTMDSIASGRAGTLENRQGELGSIDTQPTHDKQKTPVKPGGAAKASYTLVSWQWGFRCHFSQWKARCLKVGRRCHLRTWELRRHWQELALNWTINSNGIEFETPVKFDKLYASNTNLKELRWLRW